MPITRFRVVDRECGRGRGVPAGFTLLELMVVSAILALLLMVVAGPVVKSRDRGMVAAVKLELSNALKAIGMYQAFYGAYPTIISDLDALGFTVSPDVKLCRFDVSVDGVLVQLQHRGSRTRVQGQYPGDGGLLELPNQVCSDISSAAAGDNTTDETDGGGKGSDNGNNRRRNNEQDKGNQSDGNRSDGNRNDGNRNDGQNQKGGKR